MQPRPLAPLPQAPQVGQTTLPAHASLGTPNTGSHACTTSTSYRDMSPALLAPCHSRPAAGGLVSSHPSQYSLTSVVTVLVQWEQPFRVVLNISFVTTDVEHLLMSLLVICVSSWGCVYLFRSFLYLFFSLSLSLPLTFFSFLFYFFLSSFFWGRGSREAILKIEPGVLILSKCSITHPCPCIQIFCLFFEIRSQ